MGSDFVKTISVTMLLVNAHVKWKRCHIVAETNKNPSGSGYADPYRPTIRFRDCPGFTDVESVCRRLIRNMSHELRGNMWGIFDEEDIMSRVPIHFAVAETQLPSDIHRRHLIFTTLLRLLTNSMVDVVPRAIDDYGVYECRGVKRDNTDLHMGTSYCEPGAAGFYIPKVEDKEDELDDTEDMEVPSSGDSEYCNEQDQIEIFETCTCKRFKSSLNGSHGEYTESDDVKKTQNKKKPQQQLKKMAKKVVKRVARESAIQVAATFVPEPIARYAYKASSKLIRSVVSNRSTEKKLVLSGVASSYLMSHVRPFDSRVSQVCIPRPPATRSFKVTGFIRGTGAIGGNGVGFVAIAPCLSNDLPCLYYTTGAYSPSFTSQPPNDLAPGNTTSANGGTLYPANLDMINLPYSSAQLSNPVTGTTTAISGRIVSSSLRVFYTGTTLNEAGQYFGYSDPEGTNVLGGAHTTISAGTGYTTGALGQKDATEIIKVTKNAEMRLIRLGVDPNMDDYPRANNTTARKNYPFCAGEVYTLAGVSDYGAANAVVMITGIALQPFYFEMITHAEYIGPGVTQGLLSETNSDAVGYDAVKNVLNHAQREVATNPRLTFEKCLDQEMKRQGISMGNGQRSVDY